MPSHCSPASEHHPFFSNQCDPMAGHDQVGAQKSIAQWCANQTAEPLQLDFIEGGRDPSRGTMALQFECSITIRIFSDA